MPGSPPTVAYRCPACAATVASDAARCSGCGLEYSAEDNTWALHLPPGGDPPAGPGANRFESRYELLEEIGRGGMGIVYRAFDHELEEVIALKVLAPAARVHPDLVQRFKHEVKVARRLTHPCIARLHDLVEIRGQLCLSMEFIAGQSLRDRLAPGPLSPAQALAYLRHLAPALDLAHGLGIVHRDLKPGNVVIDERDVPHVLDFGIAKSQWLEEREAGALVGTPGYMAPEQWTEGAEVDGRADLYSLGVMLYEMLCGRRPFEHRNRLILMEMHLEQAPLRPRALVPDLPPGLEAMVLRLLAKDPRDRFARASEALAAIEPAPAEPAPPAPAARRRSTDLPRPVHRARGEMPPVTLLPGRRGKVLLAEDDPLLRRYLGEKLKLRQLVVVEAGDGGHALEAAFREVPDLVLLDLRMPVLDGLEVLRLLKNDARTREVPVIVMSGVRDADHVAFAKELGAATFLEKPIPPDVLELLVERYFG